MVNILIRGLRPETVRSWDQQAATQDISRNELLRRRLEMSPEANESPTIDESDWQRSRAALTDLANDDVMDRAWRG